MMTRGWVSRVVTCGGSWLVALACGLSVPAAELQVRSECRTHGTMVTLGDVVEILTSDTSEREALQGVELFPAPPAGAKRFVRAREIQDILLMRSVNLAEHRFSGAAQVTVIGGEGVGQERNSGALPLSFVKKSERRLNEAIVGYLKGCAGAQAWNVESVLDGRQARLVAAAERIAVCGGTTPWQGSQRFEVTTYIASTGTRFEVSAQVSVIPTVVVLTRAIGRGEVITAADVELRPGDPAMVETAAFRVIEEVVGKEACRAIAAGNTIARDVVRAPVIVRRGEVVTVYARSSGLRVRTLARARDEGSLDELITVESLDTRKSFFARVCGVQEVEVYAQAVKVQESAGAAGRQQALANLKPKAPIGKPEGELTSWNAPKQVSNARMHLQVEQ